MPCETATENEGVARERLCKGSSSRQAVKVIDQCKRSEVQRIKRKEERGKRKEERGKRKEERGKRKENGRAWFCIKSHTAAMTYDAVLASMDITMPVGE